MSNLEKTTSRETRKPEEQFKILDHINEIIKVMQLDDQKISFQTAVNLSIDIQAQIIKTLNPKK